MKLKNKTSRHFPLKILIRLILRSFWRSNQKVKFFININLFQLILLNMNIPCLFHFYSLVVPKTRESEIFLQDSRHYKKTFQQN
ncbi:hypothetical protein BpHYR1_047587 [Brachionus plicatilis]|uniref:Uncharacterized protein n=1 Tax=Brachionus plicatilis TaxID=10195 RepID=A0A3M7SPV9_BRAPC|nr:hypothetical protein BpHYR1_047587 [Brachionus plicatilis]